MTKLERVKAALRGLAIDRPPYGFWTHLPGIDLDPPRLVDATAAFAQRFDMDFIKSMPNGLYCVEDWGCACDYSDIERGGVAKVVQPAVRSVADWDLLARVDVRQGAFGRELDHLAALVQRVGPGTPVLATVFSPLTIAGKLSNGVSRIHARENADALKRGLEAIADVTSDFARAALERGCAGIFLAVQEATHGAFDERAYSEFGVPYDERVAQAANDAGGWFNAVHMHGEDILFDLLEDYDVAAINWHIGETAPSLGEYRSSGGAKPVLGGLQRTNLTKRDRGAIEKDIERAMTESGGCGLILAPACVIRHPVDAATLTWTANAIKALAQR